MCIAAHFGWHPIHGRQTWPSAEAYIIFFHGYFFSLSLWVLALNRHLLYNVHTLYPLPIPYYHHSIQEMYDHCLGFDFSSWFILYWCPGWLYLLKPVEYCVNIVSLGLSFTLVHLIVWFCCWLQVSANGQSELDCVSHPVSPSWCPLHDLPCLLGPYTTRLAQIHWLQSHNLTISCTLHNNVLGSFLLMESISPCPP